MIKEIFFLLIATASLEVYAQKSADNISCRPDEATKVLYRKVLNDRGDFPELILNGVTCHYAAEGLIISGNENIIRLNKYYSLGERLIRYHVKFSADAKVIFQSSTGDFKAVIDIPGQMISAESTPALWKRTTIRPDNEYIVEIQRVYQTSRIILTDIFTGVSVGVEISGSGSGGAGTGASGPHTGIVHQWDHYCFGLLEGTSFTVKQICVQALECDLTLLLYGDSQTQPEGYFPAESFAESWTQLIMRNIGGTAISSGRGGCTIVDVLDRIKNELPYVKARFVMVTIGTNGGNTEENLGELVEYIISQGSVPILNNIPCNEHGTQVEANKVIAKVREKYKINGCRFDLATSINHDGIELDKTTMWHEDYDFGQFYHHPNVKGSYLMFLRTLIDVPEIYN